MVAALTRLAPTNAVEMSRVPHLDQCPKRFPQPLWAPASAGARQR
jgi:hypothetical protein